ncbi:MAG: hypothetical protein IMX02_02940 [Limnochordaceae bacterium]|nr:hypothetical protein [Limnochordaceae bacterium]
MSRIVAMGGGARSPLWLQIKAAAVERPVIVPRLGRAASLGAMVLAGWGVGLWRDPLEAARAFNPPEREVAVDPSLAAAYRSLAERYERLVQVMMPVYSELWDRGAGLTGEP